MAACAVCGLEYDVSARTFRDIKAGRVRPRCGLHRQRSPQTRQAEFRRYWLDRFPMDEILEMSSAIVSFLPNTVRPGTGVGMALTASAAPPGPRELGGR